MKAQTKPLSERRTAIYRLRDADQELLYVGVTCNPEQRFAVHKAGKSWWPQVAHVDIDWHDDRASALRAEYAAILLEAPIHNRVFASHRGPRRQEALGPGLYRHGDATFAFEAFIVRHKRRRRSRVSMPVPR